MSTQKPSENSTNSQPPSASSPPDANTQLPPGHKAPAAATGLALTAADKANAAANGATIGKGGGASKVGNGYGYTPSENWRDRRKAFIRLSPIVVLKLKHMCLKDHVEVGGFGILTEKSCQDGDGELYISDFRMPDQENSGAFCKFTPTGIADHFEDLLEEGIQPWRSRIWIHTHPGNSPQPSGVDEQTFIDSFGGANGGSLPDWAVMMIMARDGSYYARLRVNPANGPAVQQEIDVKEDWDMWPKWVEADTAIFTSHQEAWIKEYAAKVHRTVYQYKWEGKSSPNAHVRSLNSQAGTRVYSGGDYKNYGSLNTYSGFGTFYDDDYGYSEDRVADAKRGSRRGTARNPIDVSTPIDEVDEFYGELIADLGEDAAYMLQTAIKAAATLPKNDERYADVQNRIRLLRASLQNLRQGLRAGVPDAITS